MDQQQYEPFSRLWDEIARRLGLDGRQQPPDNVQPLRPEKTRRAWPRLLAALVVLILILLSGRAVLYYTEWLWFGEVGQQDVFLKSLLTKVGLAAAAGALFFAVVYANLMLARRLAPRYQFGPGVEVIERMQLSDRTVRRLTVLALALPTLFAAGAGAAAWDECLKYINQVPFDIADPVFGRDVAFYVFSLPFLKMLQSFAWWTLIITLLATTAMHFFDHAIGWSSGRVNMAPHVKAHLSVILGLLMFVLAAGYLLKGYNLMFSLEGVVAGATYTDVHARLPVYRFLAVVAAAGGLIFWANIYFRGWKLPAAALVIIVTTSLLAGGAYPFIVQQYQVSPNELEKERPYIKNNIEYTRAAFALNDITEQPFAAAENLTTADVRESAGTLENIRLWDPQTLAQTYSQIQEIRLYYKFVDVDVDRYRIDGRLQQVMLSPRELDVGKLPEQARTWQNEHLVYTHGYGLVMSQVAQVSLEGLPLMLVKDIPPVAAAPALEVSQPAIYFGERANDYVVVRTDTQEFDYPKGDENVYTTYAGTGGVDVSSWLDRAAFAWRFTSLKMLVSDSITDQSRILIHRDIRERITNIAPFLEYDADSYSVLADGRLYWVLDAYTTTDSYPYSQPAAEGRNYIRNPVKVVVDAYNGDVRFYVTDPADPIIRTWQSVFPDLFTPVDQAPASVREHFRYPEDLFLDQASMYVTYHMTDPQVFYNKEDQWSIPQRQSGDRMVAMDPYYVIMSLPGEEKEEFILMLPFTPSNRDNMIAWMAAKSDQESYGERIVYKFPKDKLVFGPAQIQARINQDPEISRQLSLWAQKGSQVIHGNLLVIPVNESLLYVEPLYLRAERGQIPELKRVTVAYGSRIAMEENLALALEKVFSGQPVSAEVPEGVEGGTVPATLKELAGAAADHYSRAIEAQKQGDWAAYGNEIRQLEEVLGQMQAAES